jgi:hypothetical protein
MRVLRSAPAWLAASLLCLLGSCGGGGGGGGGDGPPFVFEWLATVAEIVDGNGDPATMPGVQVGDSMRATIEYDPEDFGPADVFEGGGFVVATYTAPDGLVMTYEFSSGGIFTKEVTEASVGDGSFDQFNWEGGDFGGLLFQVNDFASGSLSAPFPADFAALQSDLIEAFATLEPTGNERVEFPAPDAADAREVRLSTTLFQIVED